jgi:hypothetical protein
MLICQKAQLVPMMGFHHVIMSISVFSPRSSRLVTLNHMFEEFINTNMEGPRLASSFLGEQWIPMATENPCFVN